MLRRRTMMAPTDGAGGNDANCITLLHFDNNVTNSSSISQTWVKSPYAAYSSSIKKFGTHAIYDSYRDSGYVVAKIASSTASLFYNHLLGDWTMEAWVYLPKTYSNHSYISGLFSAQANANGYPYFSFGIDSTGFTLWHSTNGTSLNFDQFYSHAVSTQSWHHIAIVKQNGLLTIYLDGVSQESGIAWSYTPNNTYNNFTVGDYSFVYIDEFRFSNIVRWTANFTPPTEPYA